MTHSTTRFAAILGGLTLALTLFTAPAQAATPSGVGGTALGASLTTGGIIAVPGAVEYGIANGVGEGAGLIGATAPVLLVPGIATLAEGITQLGPETAWGPSKELAPLWGRARMGHLALYYIIPGALAGGFGLTMAGRLAGDDANLDTTLGLLPIAGFSMFATGIMLAVDGHIAGNQLQGMTSEEIPKSMLIASGTTTLVMGVVMMAVVAPISRAIDTWDEDVNVAIPILTGACYLGGGLTMLITGAVHKSTAATATASGKPQRRNFLAFSPVYDPATETVGVALKGTF